ncbi:NUDIX domain-containing protein [Candidatus Peregrinibacteria bacterium]|jgi:8-oxo-dGTP pyrophosphatase MutT (NUDIX family)|nr:NUDIX domain-containing protein [Candidatus Peregrinibacteria bacterium]MBT7736451.1 NUDIX domain-containing protein [Candidatus Peregrinibacteria bacterium]
MLTPRTPEGNYTAPDMIRLSSLIMDPSRERSYYKELGGRPPVPADKALWGADYPEYNPLKNCDKPPRPGKSDHLYPQTQADLLEEDRRIWTDVGGTFDETGMPLSPFRTGIEGRGECPGIGPVTCADPVVFRVNPESGKLEILLIVRATDGFSALPGGKREPKVNESGKRVGWETVNETLVKELREETGLSIDSEEEDRWVQLYEDEFVIAGDSRGTDNALFVTAPKAILLTPEEASQGLHQEDAQEIEQVKWVEVNPDNLSSLFSTHLDYVQSAFARLQELNVINIRDEVKDPVLGILEMEG